MRRVLLLSVVLASACSYPTRDRSVLPKDVGTASATKITSYLALRGGARPEEAPTAAISTAVLSDEAVLTKLTDAEACFALTTRTSSALDLPLSDWNVSVNGEKLYVGEETVTVKDYPFTGEKAILVADGVVGNVAGALNISKPEARVLRVFERATQLCGPRVGPEPGVLRLELERPQRGFDGPYGEAFVWHVRE